MYNTSLGSIIRRLGLRNVHNMCTHRRCGDKAPRREVLQLVSVDIGALCFLPPPYLRSGFGGVISPVKIGLHDLVVMVEVGIYHGPLCPRDAGVGDENVQSTVELLDYFIDGVGGGFWIADVDWVCFACWIEGRSISLEC